MPRSSLRPPSLPACPPEPGELRELLLSCFAHAGVVILATAHIVQAFLLRFLERDASAQGRAHVVGLAHGTIAALEREGVVRGVRKFDALVPRDEVDLCPVVARGVVYAEIELLVPLDELAP